jgi:hypothetical protein
MALTKPGGLNTIYLSVADGNLVRQHKTANHFTVERITKTGKQVFEEFFKDLTGVITSISTRENDYGKQWQVTFKDGEDTYIVSLGYSSRYAASFLKALPNLNLMASVRFMPWAMKDKNDPTKTITGVTLYQGDNKIAPYYTKENPNGLPQMQKIKVKGKEQWDDSEMMAFLEEMATSIFTSITATEDEDGDAAPF